MCKFSAWSLMMATNRFMLLGRDQNGPKLVRIIVITATSTITKFLATLVLNRNAITWTGANSG